MLSDPAAAAWVVAGQPPVNAPAPIPGRCGRCGEDGPTVTSSHIISEKFTGFDAWPFGSRRLCVPCAWAYSRSPIVVPAMVITADTVTEYSEGAGLAPLLTAGALPNTHAVVLPSSRRRHVLATAEWGHLATDGLVTMWNATAAGRLADFALVRRAVTAWVHAHATDSMSERQIAMKIDRTLMREMPPYPVLATQPRDSWTQFLDAWASLQPWRKVEPLWAAARTLTHTPTKAAANKTRRNSRPYA
ncbi:hypothetical protein H7J87_11730 [Mycolicibacterium wolinskyi]|uniref:Uncharacterized protein n=2 Tax=Mycobacteriaceae TaxID=1762 RepID=A0A1X2FJH7_9MYCO|nr:hypothetical protein [Mycolicibacterium wolinskyi]MCV7296196.1 hypothetical protein [Mycolicibacterium goodii]ORX18584.1 hypothetical protein AWC31_14080 [Mycolicibacterium wolinskyi]